jgi:predicted Zn-dependent protease
MEADLNLRLGEAAEAARLYSQIITDHPGYSWTPYLNLGALEEQSANKQRAYALRERAYGRFPEAGPVVIAYAGSLVEIGDLERAEEVLTGYLETHEEDYEAELTLLDVRNTASSPALYQAALWQLYNRHPESRMLCEYLFLYLLEFNDLSAAESALHHYETATGRTADPWLLDYRAVLAAVRGDLAAAARLLRERLAREDSWQGRYNLAVILGRSAAAEQVIDQLIQAENLLPSPEDDYHRSRIRSLIGEQYLRLGDEAAARRECEYALDLDVSNFHAHRILRILERQ